VTQPPAPSPGTPGAAPPSLNTLRLAFLAMLGGVGAFGPFLGLSLSRAGYSGAEVGLLLGVIPLANMVATPLWAMAADRSSAATRILQLAAAASATIVAAIAIGGLPFVALVGVLALYGLMRAPVGPVLDALTVRALELGSGDPRGYGRIRLWGSVGFLAAGATASVVADRFAAPGAPLWVAVGCWSLGTLVLLRMPATRASGPVALGASLRALGGQPGLRWLVLALPLHGLGLNAYDAWYAIHIDALGLDSAWTGAAMLVGIGAEIGLMALSARVLGRRDPLLLLMFAMGLAAVRWAIVGLVSAPLLLTAAQLSHGVVYGLFWMAATEAMRRWAAPQVRASGQALLLVACYGLGPVLTSTVGALIVPKMGTGALFLAASLASLGATALVGLAWRASGAPKLRAEG